MHLARRLLFLAVVAASVAPALGARSMSRSQSANATASASDLSIQRTRIGESDAAREAGDYDTARTIAAEVVMHLLARPAGEQDAAWVELLDRAGGVAFSLQDMRTANSAWKRVHELRSTSLGDDDSLVQTARQNLARTLYALGDLQGARSLQESVVEILSRTLPDEHFDVQSARALLATTLFALGDLQGARGLSEGVLDVWSRTLPDDHPDLQLARGNVAVIRAMLGDVQGGRVLQEKVLEVLSRTLRHDDLELQRARLNLAGSLRALGDAQGARTLQETVLNVLSRTLPDDHPDLQLARAHAGTTLYELGELQAARVMFERVLEVLSRALPDDHPELQRARANLAATLVTLGDLQGARSSFELALEVSSRTLADDHPDLQIARAHVAVTRGALGDHQGARALEEKVLEVRSRTLSDGHPDLELARSNLAVTLLKLGEVQRARVLFEKALDGLVRTLPEDHPELQRIRGNLAVTLFDVGDFQGARLLLERVLEVRRRTLHDEHPDLQFARRNLAVTIVAESARAATAEQARGIRSCTELMEAVCAAQVRAARAVTVTSPAREAEERCASLAQELDVCLSFARGYGVSARIEELERPSFVFTETTRGAAIASARLLRRATHLPKYEELRNALRAASDALAGLAQEGATSGEFDRARTKREAAERELVAFAREHSDGPSSGAEFEVEALAGRLESDQVAVSFRRYTRSYVEVVEELDATGQREVRHGSEESLCAWLVRSSKARSATDENGASLLSIVDLGPIAPIEEAAQAWRDAVGVANDSRGLVAQLPASSTSHELGHGRALRERVFDPLLPALAGAGRIILVLDDILHLVPFDALPLPDGLIVGERWRLETRSTLTELLCPPAASSYRGTLVAFGDVDYEARGVEAPIGASSAGGGAIASPVVEKSTPEENSLLEPEHARENGLASILRGGAWAHGFSPLNGTGVEVRGIARCYGDRFGDGAAFELCERELATRERLVELAPNASYLHIATHGWFAPESILSWSDAEPLDRRTGLGARDSGTEQVKGMAPMLLCGLALAGANLPDDAVGRAPGLITADEVSTLDLSNCELAVLSACDTNVGERRAGQGVASLQRALQMAGARSVITSLWKVPDEATKDLMLDFYRRLWIERKSKHQALWEAKTKLREAKDERGAPKYSTRDWAAWVLTGDPN